MNNKRGQEKISTEEDGSNNEVEAERVGNGEESFQGLPSEPIPGFEKLSAQSDGANAEDILTARLPRPQSGSQKYISYTIKLPSDQLAALQNIWLELKRLYGAHSPDKSGMIQLAIQDWLKRWDGPDRQKLLIELLEIREDTRRRQYKKG